MHQLSRLVFVFIALVLLGELLVRLTVTLPVQTRPDEKLGWLYQPHARILQTREGYAVNRMNAEGFNDDEIGMVKDKTRVLVLGDSITMALQVPRTENFTTLAEVGAPGLDFFNAGRSGFSPLYYPAVLAGLDQPYKPDIALLVLTSGDISEMARSHFSLIRDQQDGSIKDVRFNAPQVSRLRILLNPLLKNSALATHLLYRVKELQVRDNGANDETVKHENAATMQAAEKDIPALLSFILRDMARQLPVAVLYIPAFDYGSGRVAVERDESVAVGRLLQELAGNAGIPYLSAGDILVNSYRLSGQPPVGFANNNILGGHLNKAGHRAVAKALLQLINGHFTAVGNTRVAEPAT